MLKFDMSKYRVPVLPEPRIEIWLTPRKPLLSAVLTILAVFFVCMVSALVYIPFTGDPTPTLMNITKQASKTKTPTRVFTNSPTSIEQPTRTKQPARTKSPTPKTTQTTDVWKDCNAIYSSRLEIGEKAYVSDTPPLRNRLRAGPYVTNEVTGYIDPGEQVEILKGPSCSNRWVWWKVRSLENGEIGWTSEGDADNYWLIPLK
jgi:hypothetical protein